MKILVVNINWLGDAIFSTPVFKALKEAYPQAFLTCLCPPRVKDVMLLCPYVDRVIIYDEKKKHRWPWQKLKIMARLRRERFDVAVMLHRSMTRAFIVWGAGIKKRVGFSKAPIFLTHPVSFPPHDCHRANGYLKALTGLGLKGDEPVCQLRLREADVDNVEALMRHKGLVEGKYIVCHPGGNWGLKRWPVEHWVGLIKWVEHQWQWPVVLTAAESEMALCQDIINKSGGNVINLAGQTSLGESLVIFKKARAVVSADSGPLHLANSVGAYCLGLFGPTRASITGPLGIGGRVVIGHDVGCNKTPCYHLDCRDNVCMKSITVKDVTIALQRVISA